MTHNFNEPVAPLVHAAAIESPACRAVALILAELQDCSDGFIQASMATLAEHVGLSTVQTRKHVHALIRMGLLRVLANAHGGAPGSVPHYQFDVQRLRVLGQQPGATPDLFKAVAAPRRGFYAANESANLAIMAIELHGGPGLRCIRFVRQSEQGDVPYGTTPLKDFLRPFNSTGGWSGWLNPQKGAPSWTGPVFTAPETAEQLQRWAQETALGRSEGTPEELTAETR